MEKKKLENIENQLKLLTVKVDIVLSKLEYEEQRKKNHTSFPSMDNDDDDLYDDAFAIIVKAGKASPALLQRRLQIGYARAARLMDIFEEKGVVGPQKGAKPRDVLIKK